MGRPRPGGLRWRVVVAAALVIGVVLGWAAAAGAHAVVVSSSPKSDERLATAPREVSITFSEPVSPEVGGLRVLDERGSSVDAGPTTQPTPEVLRVALQPDLGDGTYVANYKVISADGHPVAGAVVFGVGSGSLTNVSELRARTEPALEAIAAITRWFAYVAVLLVAGLAFFVNFVHDGGPDEAPLRRVVRVGTIVAGAAVVALIAAAAMVAVGAPSGAWSLSAWRAVLRQGLGWQSTVIFVGLALCHLSIDVRRGPRAQGLAFYGGLTAAAGFVFWGHALQSPHVWVAAPSTVVHVAAAAAWFGALVGMSATIVRRVRAVQSAARAGEPDAAADLGATAAMVARFSTLAAVSILLLAAAGVGLTYSEVGSLDRLVTTTYGKTLLVKLGVVAVVLAVAAYNRFQLVPWLRAGLEIPTGDATDPDADTDADPKPDAEPVPGADPEPDPAAEAEGWRTLARTMRFEAVGLVVALAVTAVLVNVTPAIDVVTGSEPLVESRALASGATVEFIVTPNRPGPNNFHVTYTDSAGRIDDSIRKAQLELRMPEKGIGPITRDMIKIGAGHYTLENVNDMAIPGTWEITLISRTSDFDQERTTFQDTIS